MFPRMGRFRDVTGQHFGRLTAVRLSHQNAHGSAYWLCTCCCGKSKTIQVNSLITGNTRSCGCLRSEQLKSRRLPGSYWSRSKVRGGPRRQRRHPLRSTWNNMIRRCRNPKDKSYLYYGGRGIRVCQRWQKFRNFLEDMGPKPSPFHMLDRVNNDGNYEPGNVRWATPAESNRNRRPRNNAKVTP